MISIANAQKAAERHDCIGDFPRLLINHQVKNRAKALAGIVVNRRSLNLSGGNERGGLFRGSHSRLLSEKRPTSAWFGKFRVFHFSPVGGRMMGVGLSPAFALEIRRRENTQRGAQCRRNTGL